MTRTCSRKLRRNLINIKALTIVNCACDKNMKSYSEFINWIRTFMNRWASLNMIRPSLPKKRNSLIQI